MNPRLFLSLLFLAGCSGRLVFGINNDVDKDGDLRDKDCNDLNASQAHGNFEWSDDGLDNNCNNLIDEANALADITQSTQSPVVSLLFTNFNGGDSDKLIIGNPEGTDTREGGLLVISPDGRVIDSIVGAESYDQFGSSLALCAGGLVAVGALGADVNGTASGSVSLLVDQQVEYDVVSGPNPYGNFGASVACFTNETDEAVLLGGAPGNSVAYVASVDSPTEMETLVGEDLSQFGTSVANGDVDGDGIPDLFVGSPNAGASSGDPTGAVDVYTEGVTDESTLTLQGTSSYTQLGYSIATVGDVDGDGLDDLLISAPGTQGFEEATGVGYLIFGADLVQSGLVDAMALATLTGVSSIQNLGLSVSGLGDINADDIPDFFISGATNTDGNQNTAQGYVFLGGNQKGKVPTTQADAVFGGETPASFITAAGYATLDQGSYHDSLDYTDFAVFGVDTSSGVFSGSFFNGQANQVNDMQ